MKEAIRVLLVGDNEVAREELNQMLDSEEGITVVGTVGSGEEALAAAKKLSPGVVLMLTDIRIPGMNIIDTARAITEAQLPAKVIIITEDFPRYLVPAVKAGAAGLLARDTSFNELELAIRKIHLCSPGSFSSQR